MNSFLDRKSCAAAVRAMASAVAVLLISDSLLLPLAQAQQAAQLWQQRRQAAAVAASGEQYAALPAALSAPLPAPSALRFSSPRTPAASSPDVLRLVAALPATAGDVRAITSRESPRATVVHIQDIHSNDEAQENIRVALASLMDHGHVSLIALEGAFSPIDLSRMRAFPKKDTIRRVADYLLSQHLISGAVRAGLDTESSAHFVGIDDAALHEENRRAYVEAAPDAEHLKAIVAQARTRISAEKAGAFSADLTRFDGAVEAYRDGKTPITDYVPQLFHYTDDISPRLQTFIAAAEIESRMNFEKVEAERSRVLSHLVSVLSAEQLAELLRRGTAYRAGAMRHAEFYAYLNDLCRIHGINLKSYPAMDDYVRYVLLSDSVDAVRLLQDVSDAERIVYRRLAPDPRQRALLDESERLHLAGKLLTFSLTNDEWRRYQELSGVVISEIPASALAKFEAFYRAADKRDETMADRFIEELARSKATTAVLVTGGFHSRGIEDRLAKRGIQIVTFVPSLSKVDAAGGSYLTVFAREHTPLDRLFEGQKLFLAPDPAQFNRAPVLAAALNPIEPQNVVNALAPETPVSVSLVSAEEGSTRLHVTNGVNGTEGDVIVGYDDDSINSVREEESAPQRLLASARERFRLSPERRFQLMVILARPAEFVLATFEFFHAPRFLRRAFLASFAGLMIFNTALPAFSQTPAGARPQGGRPAIVRPAAPQNQQARPQAPPAASRRSEKPTPASQAANERHMALGDLRKELEAARTSDTGRITGARRAVLQIRNSIDNLRRNIDERQRLLKTEQESLVRTEAEQAKTRGQLEAAAFKTSAPATEIHNAASAVGATKWNSLADDVAAMRTTVQASGVAGTEKNGVISDRFDRAEASLRALADAAKDLKALDDRVSSNPVMTEPEAAALADRLDDIKVAIDNARDVPTLISEAEDAALGLNAISGKDRDDFSARAGRVGDATRAESLSGDATAITTLSSALINWNSSRAEAVTLDRHIKALDGQIVVLKSRISALQSDVHVDLKTGALADQIDRLAEGRTIEDLAREAELRLHALHPAGGTWGAALQAISDALNNLKLAQQQLRDNTLTPEEHLKALNVAILSISEIRRAEPAFNQLLNPEYQDELGRLPKDPDVLSPEARRSYDAFRRQLNKESPANIAITDQEALAQWYGHFIRQSIGIPFSTFDLNTPIVAAQGAITNALNLHAKAEALNLAATRDEAQRAAALEESQRLERELQGLKTLGAKIAKDGDRAARLAPNARVVTESYRPPSDRMGRVAKAVDALNARPIKFIGTDGQTLRDLINRVGDDARKLSGGTMSNADAAAARARLSQLIQHFDDLVNPAIVTYGDGDVHALRDLMHETVDVGIVWLAGLSEERLRAGVTGEDSYEDRLVRAAVAIYGAPAESLGARRNLEQLKKNAQWSAFDLLEAVNLFTGLMNLHQNFDTFMGRKNPFTFTIEREGKPYEPLIEEVRSLIPAAKGPALLLGSANAFVSANGAVTELRLALTGETPERAIPYFVSTLFPEAFNNTVWEIVNPSASDEAGYVYYRTTGFAIRTKIGEKNERKMSWAAVTDRSQAINRLYRVRNGVIEVMASGKDRPDLEARVNHLVRATQAINGVIAFSGGLRTKIVSPTPTALARVNSALAIINTVSGLFELMDKVNYKNTLASTYGGWVTSPDPNFSARMTLVYPDGTRVEMGALRDNGALLVHRENVWESPEGTPVYRTGRGRLKIALNLFRLSLRVWNSAERFQESIREAGKSNSLSTAHDGVFVRRRPDSAPMRVVADNGQILLQTTVFGRTERFMLGVPAHDVPVDGQNVTARPFYSINPNGEPGALVGVLIGDVSLQSGDTVSYRLVFSYLGSLPQKLNGLLVQMGIDHWYELNPLEGRFAQPGIPAFPGAGWTVDLDGVARFTGANAAGDKGTLFLRWTDDEGTFVLDMEKQVLYRFGVDSTGRPILTGVRGTSLPSLAQARERVDAEDQWVRESSRRRTAHAIDVPLRGFGPDVNAWIDISNGTMYVSVPALTVIEGVRFPDAGTYRYQLGGQGVRHAEEAVTHPFYRRQPLPLAPDLSRVLDIQTAEKNVRRRADGTSETWYAGRRLVPGAKVGDPAGMPDVYVEYTEGGRRRVDRVTVSSQGQLYDASVADAARPWNRRLVLPDNLTWSPAPVPGSIAPFIPQGVAGADIAVDSRGRFYARVTMADGRVFGFEAGASPAEMRAEAAAIENGPATATLPLPDGLPDSLMSRLPAVANGDIVKLPSGAWAVRLRTVSGVQSRIEQLSNGRVIRTNARTIDEVATEFRSHGLELRPGGESIPFGGLSVTPYLAFETGRTVPTSVVVVVDQPGTFVHPEKPNVAPVDVQKGEILQIELGRNPTILRRSRQESPRPFLDRVFQSRAAIGRLSAEPIVDQGRGHLPAAFGAGAEKIAGRWFVRQPMVNGQRETTETYFEVESGGVVVDPVTGESTRLEPGSIWIVERTAAGAQAHLAFSTGRHAGWMVRVGGDQTLAPGALFSVPGVNGPVPGRIVMPTTPDAAPVFVVTLPAGETRLIHDVTMGDVLVASGDVLVYQWPTGFQRASMEAQGRSERLYLPSIVTRAEIQSDYEATSSPDQTPRRLIRGAAHQGLLPEFPADVALDVWADPHHPDAPLVVEVTAVPNDGRTWTHPQLGIQIPLKVGTTFVRVPTLVEMQSEQDALANSARPYLVETPWDATSTELNLRRAFNARRDAAAQWRRKNNHTDSWSFQTRVGGLSATVFEDISNPNSSYLNPALDLVIFNEEGTVNGLRVRPGVVYRRNAGLPVADARVERLERHWGVGYPAGRAGADAEPIVFDRPVLTGRRYLHATRPFFSDGRPNLVNSGTPDRAVQVVRINGTVYVVEGKAPSTDSKALVFNLANGNAAEVHSPDFRTPQFGGLTLVRYLDQTARAKLEARVRELTGGVFELDPRMMVRLNAQRQPEALVVLGLPGVEWATARQDGLGMIQFYAGSHNARLEATPARRTYAGWVGIGQAPGFLTIDQVTANILPKNGVDGANGWVIVNEKSEPIGDVIFGDKAPQEPVDGLVALYDLKTRTGRVVTGDRYDVPELSGIARYDSLNARQRAQLRDVTRGTAAGRRAPNPGMLVRLDPTGRPVSVAVPRTAARNWVNRRLRGYGYIQMDAGAHENVDLNGVRNPRSLNGWISIGKRDGELTPDHVARNLSPANGRDGTDGWILIDKNGRRLGFYIEGALKLPVRPDFLVHLDVQNGTATPPGGTVRQLLTEELTPALEKQLRPVVRLNENGAPGRWVWAAFVGGAWRQFRPAPGAPGNWVADATTPALNVSGSPIAEKPPRGIVDGSGKVTSIVSTVETKSKATNQATPPAPSPWAVQSVDFHGQDNSSHVRIHNGRTNETAVDSYFGRYPSYRTYLLEDAPGRWVETARVTYRYDAKLKRTISLQKDEFDFSTRRWFHKEDYSTETNQSFTYPDRSPNSGVVVTGDVLTARDPVTHQVMALRFYAGDDGRLIWTQVETMLTVQFYGPNGQPTGQWTYNLSPSIKKFEKGAPASPAPRRRGSSLSPDKRTALLAPNITTPPESGAVVTAPPAPSSPRSPQSNPANTTRVGSADRDHRSPIGALLALLGMGGVMGIMVTRRTSGRGAGNGGTGDRTRGEGPEDKLAQRVARSLLLISQMPIEGQVDEDQKTEALAALENLFEGAPLDQGLASVDGRVDSLLGAFRGEGVNGPIFRAAFRREMDKQFGRDIPLDEALGLAHAISIQGAEMAPMAEVLPATFGDGAAAVVVVTEAMRPRLRELVAAIPTSTSGRRVIFIAENADLREAVAAAAAHRSDAVALDGSAAFAGSTIDRTRRLSLNGLETLLTSSLAPDFFATISALTLISPDGLPIDTQFSSGDAGVVRDLLRQAAIVLINEQLQAAAISFGTLESIGALARVISSQA